MVGISIDSFWFFYLRDFLFRAGLCQLIWLFQCMVSVTLGGEDAYSCFRKPA